MLELNAKAFYGAVNAMRHMETAIEGRRSVAQDAEGGAEVSFITDLVLLDAVSGMLVDLECEVRVLGARLTLFEIERLKDLISHKGALTP